MSAAVPERTCSWPDCSERGDFQCSRCPTRFYCSADHQQKDWPNHKRVCGKPVSKHIDVRGLLGQQLDQRTGPGVPSSRAPAILRFPSSWAAGSSMAESEERTVLLEQQNERAILRLPSWAAGPTRKNPEYTLLRYAPFHRKYEAHRLYVIVLPA